MAQEIILTEQEVVCNQMPDTTLIGIELVDSPLFIEGEEYTVVIDSVSFPTMGGVLTQTSGDDTATFYYIGNPFMLELPDVEDTGEHFVAVTMVMGEMSMSQMVWDDPSGQLTHTVGIYKGAAQVGTSIVLKDRNGNDVTYEGIETITFDKPNNEGTATFTLGVEQKGLEVELNLKDGDQTVKADSGHLLKSLIIKKPESLKSSNIRKGENVCGEDGEFIGDTEEVTVGESDGAIPLDFTGGDQEIFPSADGKVLSKVIIEKPAGLKPENIAKDVVIGGYVGTHEGGSGYKVSAPEWIDDICFWNYDGTLAFSLPVSEAKNLKELPEPTKTTGLLKFQEWNHTLEEVRAAKYPLDIGASCTTQDGKTYLLLNITSSSYKEAQLHFSQTVANGVTVDWGDGSTSTSDSTIGVTSLTHTYSSLTTYSVYITVAGGCTMTLGGGTSSTSFVGGSNSNYKKQLLILYVGDNVVVGPYALYSNSELKTLTLPLNSVTELPSYGISSIPAKCVTIPRSCISIADNGLMAIAASYKEVYNSVVSIPQTVSTIGVGCCNGNSYMFRLCLPHGITQIHNNMAQNCRSMRRFFMSDTVTSIGNYFLYSASSLLDFTFPSSVTSIGDSCLGSSSVPGDIIIPDTAVTIGSGFLQLASFSRLIIKGTIESIGTSPFSSSKGHRDVLFYKTTPSAAVKAIASGLNYYANKFVPDEAYSAYYNAVSSDYRGDIYKFSEYGPGLPD